MARGGRARVACYALACAVLLPDRALAAVLPGVQIDVARDPGAATCPDGQAISEALGQRLGMTRIEGAPVVIEIEIRSSDGGFESTVRASGGKRGVRNLSAPGPTCDALRETLLVSLLVLLDRDPEHPELVREAPAPEGPKPSFWVGGGGAFTRGFPSGSSAAFSGELGGRYLGHSIWLGGIWTPERDVPFGPGFVAVSAVGGQLRACSGGSVTRGFRIDGCGLGLLMSLRGKARDYTTDSSVRRPWWLVGAGAELAFDPEPWFSAAVAGRLLFSPGAETFSIEGLDGTGYETETVIGWLGLSLSAKIW
jgi:hypothetical protein